MLRLLQARFHLAQIVQKHHTQTGAWHTGGAVFWRREQRGEPHRQIDVLAVNIVVIGDKRCNVGTCAQVQLLLRRHALVGLVGKQVSSKCGFHAVLRAGKFDHQTVAQAFDQPPTVKGKELLLHMRHQFLPPPYEPICVLLHEPDGFHDVQDQ